MKNTRILFFIIFNLLFGLSFAQSNREAEEMFRNKNFTSAFSIFSKNANNGDSYAQARLAMLYAQGIGTNKDDNLSFEWAKKSAEQGNAIGQNTIAVNYLNGRGVTKDDAQAFSWFAKSAAQGFSVAMVNLANMHRDGRGTQKNIPKAIELYNNSITRNPREALAYLNLSVIYELGNGVPQDLNESLRLVQLGKNLVDPNSPNFSRAEAQIVRINNLISQNNKLAQPSPTPQHNHSNNIINSNITSTNSTKLIFDNDPQKQCELNLSLDKRLSLIANKIPLAGPATIDFTMLANLNSPNTEEQRLIAIYADGLKSCRKSSNDFKFVNYSKEHRAILSFYDSKLFEIYINLFNKKIKYSESNAQLQLLEKQVNEQFNLLISQENSKKLQQEISDKARSDALKQAQINQEAQKAAEQLRIQQERQNEIDRLTSIRAKWTSRCNLDRVLALERGKINYKNECSQTYANATNNSINRFGATMCVLSIDQKAEEFAKTTFDACMSGAP
jgi:hypothetical protein